MREGLARAVRGPAGAQGQGSRPQAVSVTGTTGLWAQDAVIFSEPGRRMDWRE